MHSVILSVLLGFGDLWSRVFWRGLKGRAFFILEEN